MSQRIKVELGDYFRIPLGNGSFAYCQYVHQSKELGYLVRVFDRISTVPVDSVEALKGSGLLFPPVFVGLLLPVRTGRWHCIGRGVVGDFAVPLFRQTMGTKPGVYDDWRIWDGTDTTYIGKLPEAFRSLELKSIWGCEALEDRIKSGYYRGDQML